MSTSQLEFQKKVPNAARICNPAAAAAPTNTNSLQWPPESGGYCSEFASPSSAVVHHAAVDGDHLPGNERRRRTSQKDRHIADVFWRPEAADGDARQRRRPAAG